MTDEQIQKLALALAETMAARQPDPAPVAPVDPAPADPAPVAPTDPAPVAPADPAPAAPFSMQELIAGVTTAIQGANQADANKVYETLFNDKLTSATGAVPGLQEYLEGKDDFGNVRMDILKTGDNYQDRITKLETVTESFKQATAANGGQAPTVSKKAQEAAVANQTKYDEIDKKWDEGGYTSVSEFTGDFFKLLSEEAASLGG